MEVLEKLSDAREPLRAVLLTAKVEDEEIAAAIARGFHGVVLKDSSATVLFKCIECVAEGQCWVGRQVVSELKLVKGIPPETAIPHAPDSPFGLTPRELEVVRAVAGGDRNQEIATQLGVRVTTVKHHLTNVFDKVGMSTRLELTMFALRHGIVPSCVEVKRRLG